MDAINTELRSCKKAPDAARIYSPGELEHETTERYREEGFPLNDETLAGIANEARALGIDVTALLHSLTVPDRRLATPPA